MEAKTTAANRLKAKFDSISKIGVHDGMSFNEIQKIKFTNNVVFLCLPMVTIYLIYNILFVQRFYGILFGASWILIAMILLLLNKKNYPHLANLFFIIATSSLTGLLHYLYGNLTKFEVLYLGISFCVTYLFDGKTKVILIISVISLYFSVVAIVEVYGAPLDGQILMGSQFFYFLFTIITVALLVNSFMKESKNYMGISELKNQELIRKNEELERFSYMVAHDLKTPLRNISSYISLEEKKKGKGEELSENIRSAKQNAIVLHNLIEDILEYTKLGFIQEKFIEINLKEELTKLREIFSHDLATKDIVLNDVPCVFGDKVLLRVLFQNLVENGLKFNKSEKPTVTISGFETEDKVTIQVIDNGIGIKQDYLDQIFHQFNRLHSVKEYHGTGLGLAICKKIMNTHKGDIIVTSELGQGTTFSLIFPKNSNINVPT